MRRTTWLAIGMFASVAAAQQERVTVAGRVVDMQGRGVVAAQVEVARWLDGSFEPQRTRTDGEGVFRLALPAPPPATMHRLVVNADGMSRVVAHSYTGVIEQPIVLHEAATLRGVLRDADGAPLANVEVLARSDADALKGAESVATTDEHGRFRLDAVAIGPTTIRAFAAGHGMFEATQHVVDDAEVTLAPAAGETTSISVTLEGDVTDLGDGPIVLLRMNGMLGLPKALAEPTFADGRWSFDMLPDRDGWLDARFASAPIEPGFVQLRAGSGPHDVTLRVLPVRVDAEPLTFTAVVTDAAGAPLPDLELELQSLQARAATSTATTDADGRATFSTPLAPGTRALITIRRGDYRLQRRGEAVVPTTQSFGECVVEAGGTVELFAAPTCSVTGRILRPDGRPAPFVAFEWLRGPMKDRPYWSPFGSAHTDEAGRYHLQKVAVCDVPVRVRVASIDGTGEGPELRLETAGVERNAGDLTLAPPAAVRGILRDATGAPVAGAPLRMRLATPQRRRAAARGLRRDAPQWFDVVTGRDGTFRFVGVPPGDASIEQVFDGRPPAQLTKLAVPRGGEGDGAEQPLELATR